MSIRCLEHKEVGGRLFSRRRKEKQLARMQIAKCIVELNTFACKVWAAYSRSPAALISIPASFQTSPVNLKKYNSNFFRANISVTNKHW